MVGQSSVVWSCGWSVGRAIDGPSIGWLHARCPPRLDRLVKEAVFTEALQLCGVRPRALLEAHIGKAAADALAEGFCLEAGSDNAFIPARKLQKVRAVLNDARHAYEDATLFGFDRVIGAPTARSKPAAAPGRQNTKKRKKKKRVLSSHMTR